MPRPQDRHSRRKPFTNWMKRLANLKSSSSDTHTNSANKPTVNSTSSKLKTKKAVATKNSPYLASHKAPTEPSLANSGNGHLSFYTPPSGRSVNYGSPTESRRSLEVSSTDQPHPGAGNKSAAPTISTNPETTHSDAAYSKAGTTTTGGGALSTNGIGGGEGSTFSSPTPSVRSLTTTLTTIQSTAPSNFMTGTHNHHPQHPSTTVTSGSSQPIHFSHQFPSSPPASAIPSHVVHPSSGGHPATYSTATANNLLTDNASILTLASSSKRRRRNSLDTNASVRALAPSSLFGGSRESLPLSVLSSTVAEPASGLGPLHGRASVGGLGNTERASVYSSSGIGPALSSERNSYYANKQINADDGASVRSRLVSHGRNDSTTGSIGGLATAGSPLASPREAPGTGRISRRNSGWGEVDEEASEEEEEDKTSLRTGSAKMSVK
ncbi:hypothetical protein MMC34_001345 [Xylographa carneopallida]|nr:hypothetical protein [Xylographa carneopallida]